MLLLLDFQETFLPALLTFIVFEEPAVTVILELLIVGVLAAYVVEIKQVHIISVNIILTTAFKFFLVLVTITTPCNYFLQSTNFLIAAPHS